MDPDSPLSQFTFTGPTPGYWRVVYANSNQSAQLHHRPRAGRTRSAAAPNLPSLRSIPIEWSGSIFCDTLAWIREWPLARQALRPANPLLLATAGAAIDFVRTWITHPVHLAEAAWHGFTGDLRSQIEVVAEGNLAETRLTVVHVVQDLVVRAPQKYHAPLTVTVNHGSLRSVTNANCPASICKGAGRGVGPLFIAKVRVAGSNPVVRSKKIPREGA